MAKGGQFFFDLSFPSHREVYHGCNFLYKLIMGVHNNLKEGRFPSLGSWSDNQRHQRRSLYLSKIIWWRKSEQSLTLWKQSPFKNETRNPRSVAAKFDVLALDGKLAENFIQSEENPLRAVSTCWHLTISPQHALKHHHNWIFICWQKTSSKYVKRLKCDHFSITTAKQSRHHYLNDKDKIQKKSVTCLFRV